jgi:hypothetical protein
MEARRATSVMPMKRLSSDTVPLPVALLLLLLLLLLELVAVLMLSSRKISSLAGSMTD